MTENITGTPPRWCGIESPYTDDVLEITMTKDIDEERFRQEENFRKERAAKDLLEAALRKGRVRQPCEE